MIIDLMACRIFLCIESASGYIDEVVLLFFQRGITFASTIAAYTRS